MYSGAEIIQDRLVFAASNYKPLKQLRDSWAAAASTWLNQYTSLKRAYDNELEKLHVRAAEVRAAAASRDARGHDDGTEPPPKRMRVRTSQVFKEHHPGSLTVNPGDMCVFLEACTNPRWSRVKMLDDGRVGIVSASKMEEAPEEQMADPSDDDEEMKDPTDDEAQEEREQQIQRDQADEQFNERCHANEEAAVLQAEVTDAETEAAAAVAAAEYAAAAASKEADR